jgi:phage tail sheath protein FI
MPPFDLEILSQFPRVVTYDLAWVIEHETSIDAYGTSLRAKISPFTGWWRAAWAERIAKLLVVTIMVTTRD